MSLKNLFILGFTSMCFIGSKVSRNWMDNSINNHGATLDLFMGKITHKLLE